MNKKADLRTIIEIIALLILLTIIGITIKNILVRLNVK